MNEEKKEIKQEEKECTNCAWNGYILSKSCRTRGSFIMKDVIKDGITKQEEVHKTNKEGLQRCDGCGYLDNKCPVCGDEVGKPGVREEIRKALLAKEKAEREAIDAGIKGGAIY